MNLNDPMIAPEIDYRVAKDGTSLASRVWRVDDAIADVICLHGIISHSGWYEASGSHLAAGGMNVHFLDRRGSGLNLVSRGDVDDWQRWVGDVLDYVERLPAERPKVLLGISWGGILATSVIAQSCEQSVDNFVGLALICPGLFSRKAATAVQRQGLRIAAACGLQNQRVAIPLKDPALFTNSPRWRAYIAEDPLTLRQITIRFALQNLALLSHATRSPENIDLPVLLMLAGQDPITDNTPTREFFQRMASDDKTVIEYAGASHTLEFEDDPAAYFRDLTAWCQRVAGLGVAGLRD